MKKETVAMRFYPESVIPKRVRDEEPVESLEELERFFQVRTKSYAEFMKRVKVEERKWVKNGVVDYNAWEKEDPDYMTLGLAEFNAFNGLEFIEHDIEVKKQQNARRKEMHTELFFYQSDVKDYMFVLDDHIDKGYGVFVTPRMGNEDKVNYLLEVPELTEINHIDYGQPVPEQIINAVSSKFGYDIPFDVCADARLFKAFISSQNGGAEKLAGEKTASELLCSIGVNYICIEDGMIVLNPELINVIRCEDD